MSSTKICLFLNPSTLFFNALCEIKCHKFFQVTNYIFAVAETNQPPQDQTIPEAKGRNWQMCE